MTDPAVPRAAAPAGETTRLLRRADRLFHFAEQSREALIPFRF